MRALGPVTLTALIVAGSSVAHGATAASGGGSAGWSWGFWVLASLALAGCGYVLGFARLRPGRSEGHPIGIRRCAAFLLGLLTIFIAVVSPIHELGERLLTMHMVEHLLLIFVAAPLLVHGRPGIAFLWLLPRGARKGLGRCWGRGGLAGLQRRLMHPVSVWILFCGGFTLWHLPRLYQWALRDEAAHALEHASFLLVALMFWTVVMEPPGRRRLGDGGRLILIVHTAILSGMPGALIALAPRPLYPAYGQGAAAWGLTLLQDQQLAGIVMWVPAGLAYLAAGSLVFLRWLRESERRQERVARKIAPLAAATLLPLLLMLGGCGGDEPSVPGTSRARGAQLVQNYGCGSCHTIPGVPGAQGLVAPPLNHMGRRVYIAGLLRNTPDNLALWIREPQRVLPGNAMPDMGVSERDARDLAAYLHALR